MTTPSYITLENSTLKLSELLTQIEAVIAGGVSELRTKGSVKFADSLGAYKGALKYDDTGACLKYTNDGETWTQLSGDIFKWSASAVYALGDMVWYSGNWYRCTSAGTKDVPGYSAGWAILTPGSRIRYVGSKAELEKALADKCPTVVLTGNISESISASITTACDIAIYSGEGISINGNIAITAVSGCNIYWHSYGTAFNGQTIGITNGTLWINRLSVGSVTLTGDVKYQRISGSVTGGTKAAWDGVDISDLVNKDLSSLAEGSWNDSGLLYAYDNGPKRLTMKSLAEEAASRSVKYVKLDKSDILANRPVTAPAGYKFYATDTGDLYNMLVSGEWSLPLHVQGPQGKIAVPSITSTGVLKWQLSDSASPSLPADIKIKGEDGTNGVDGVNGYTMIPSINAEGMLSWTVGQPSTAPTPPSPRMVKGADGQDGVDGQNGWTVVPKINTQTGTLSWTAVRSTTEPAVPASLVIKGQDGEDGEPGAPGQNGWTVVPRIDQTTGTLSWTASRASTTPAVPASLVIKGQDGEDGAPGTPGQNGWTVIPSIDQTTGTLSWAASRSSAEPAVPSSLVIKGADGQDGQDGANGQNGWTVVPSIDQTTGTLSWTASRSSTTPAVPPAVVIKGQPGQDGENGQNGWTVIPSVSTSGVLSWTRSRAETEPPLPTAITIKGQDGQDGANGQNGWTVVPSIDQTTGTLSWTASRSSTTPVVPASLVIKGKDGQDGEDGAPGTPGQNGWTVVPSIDRTTGTLSWRSTRSSTEPTVPDPLGIKGEPGTPGTNGQNGWTLIPEINSAGVLSWRKDQTATEPSVPDPVSVKGPEGKIFKPTVADTGIISWEKVSEADLPASVNIKGPKGDKGDQGYTGEKGDTGESPVVSFIEHQAQGYRTMQVTVGSTVTSTNIYNGSQGTPGPAGDDAYVYIRYAADTQGTGFSSTPSDNLQYIGILHSTVEIATPVPSQFVGLWTKYIADSSKLSDTPAVALGQTASAGTATEASRADHVHPTTGLITAPASTGTEDQLLAKAASGYKWVDQLTWGTLPGKPILATVATTGKYDDLLEKPSLATVATTGSYLSLTDRPVLATVASTGAYGDLTGKPTINDAKITIKQGSTERGSFTLNQGSDYTVQLDAGGSGSAVWGEISGAIEDQTDLITKLSEKMTAPTTGSAGQVLTKNSTGYSWATPAGNMSTSDYVYPGGTGVVLKADKAITLATARYIGSAEFDGSSDISLISIGAASIADLASHVADTGAHVTASEKATWNEKADESVLLDHTGNTAIHVSSSDKQNWNAKADSATVTNHTTDSSIHVTAADKTSWNAKLAADNTGTSGQVLTKTSSGCQWETISASSDAVISFSSTTKSWTSSDIGKLYRYTGEWRGSDTYLADTVYSVVKEGGASVLAARPLARAAGTAVDPDDIGNTLYLRPGGYYSYAVSSESYKYLEATGVPTGVNGFCFLDINPGNTTLYTSGLTFVDALVPNTVNHCFIYWSNGSARLYLLDRTAKTGALTAVIENSDQYFNPVPGNAYKWAPTATTAYMMQTKAEDGKFGSCDIDIVAGTTTFNFGFSGTVTLVGDDITANKTNHCKLWFRGATAYLQVLFAD